MPLRSELADLRSRLQDDLFPWLAASSGPLSGRAMLLITVIELVPLGVLLPPWSGRRGRPPKDRHALARAFIAKAVYDIPTTEQLIDRLRSDKALRQLCGWASSRHVPDASTFSRAFEEFAEMGLPTYLHAALVEDTYKENIVGHVSRDATAIEAREKPAKKEPPKRTRRKKKENLPKRGEPGWEGVPRLVRQQEMTHAEMLADLPRHCAIGAKIDAKGRKSFWNGYKLHIDTADGGVPLACLLTSASLHDSQAAVPLAMLTSQRVTACYDLMDASYQAPEILAAVRKLGRVPIVPEQARKAKGRKAELQQEALARRNIRMPIPEEVRYRQRTVSERVNARLKDEFGGRHVRVRGAAKVLCHLMFGVLVLAIDQLMRLNC